MAKTIAVVGALDTKGPEFAFVKAEIEARGARYQTADLNDKFELVLDITALDLPDHSLANNGYQFGLVVGPGASFFTFKVERSNGFSTNGHRHGQRMVVQAFSRQGFFQLADRF